MEIFRNILTLRGEFGSLETGIPGGPDPKPKTRPTINLQGYYTYKTNTTDLTFKKKQ